jgi:hypothetical protein
MATAALGLAAPGVNAGPFVCDYDPRIQIGTIQAGQSPHLNEASGLVQSRNEPEVFWSHQDNSNDERLFAIRRDGTYLGTWDLDVGSARDPEDIAIGPGPVPGVDYIFFGDVGYNNGIWGCTIANSNTGNCAGCPAGQNCQQRDLRVWRAAEPDVDPFQSFVTVGSYPADTITLKFPDVYMLGQRQDVEAMMVDPQTGDLYIATKRSTPGMVFRAPYPHSTTQPITMEWVADLPFGGDNQATGGDISADGRLIIIRRYGDGYIWQRPDGTSVAAALAGGHCRRTGLGETQGEAVTFDISSSGTFYTTSEGGGAVPIYLYRMVNDGCSADADCADGAFCNGDETCVASLCQPGEPIVCDDGVTCTEDICNESTDVCDFTADDSVCDDGLFCNGAETCDVALDCQPAQSEPCGGAFCDEETDQCEQPPEAPLNLTVS